MASLGWEQWHFGSGLNSDCTLELRQAGVAGGAVVGYKREESGCL